MLVALQAQINQNQVVVKDKMKKNILFLCTGNSCRSQMAEGFARKYFNLDYNIYSAGIEKHGMNQNAVFVMSEVGIDISKHWSKCIADLGPIYFDYIFTVCGHAHENCPVFLGKGKIIHVGFDDPPKLALGLTTESEILQHYRRVRDEIDHFAKNINIYLD